MRTQGSGRPLTERERAVLVAMIERGVDDDDPPSEEDRQRWLAQVPEVRVVGGCRCGTCPSLELRPTGTPETDPWETQVVLEAGADGALLLLFVHDDRLSELELAPVGDRTFEQLPDVEQMTFYR